MNCLAFDDDGTRLASGHGFKHVAIWNVAEKRLIRRLDEPTGTVERLVFSPDGSRVVACGSRNLTVWGPETGDALVTFRAGGAGAAGLAFSADGSRIIAIFQPGSVRIWNGRR